MALEYPAGFPQEFLRPVVAAQARAEREFREAVRELGARAVRPAAMDYMTTVTLVFAHQTREAVRAGTLPEAEMGWMVEEGLRQVAVHAYRDFDLRRQWSAWESFYEFTQTHVRWSDGWLAHLDEAASVSERSPNATGIEGPSDESSEEPGTEARIEEEREESRDRRSQVDAFLEECNRVNDSPGEILRKHISLAGGHKTPRQFQRWQSSSDKAPAEDARNFGRLLSMNPPDFVELLKKKNLT